MENFSSVDRGMTGIGIRTAIAGLRVAAISMLAFCPAHALTIAHFEDVGPTTDTVKVVVTRTTETTPMGTLEWKITDAWSNAVIDARTTTPLLCDVEIVQYSCNGSTTDTSKRLPLSKGFWLKLHPSEKTKSGGFALVATRDEEYTDGWDWFNQVGKGRATKLQEPGEMKVEVRRNGTVWDMTRTKFLTDVSLRVYSSQPTLRRILLGGREPRYRVLIRKGSDIRWPSPVGSELKMLGPDRAKTP